MNRYEFVKKLPVARFYYKGCHTHPVRRTILVTNETKNTITGYEVREGRETRVADRAPIKTFCKKKIARYGVYCRLKMSKNTCYRKDYESTLIRSNLEEFVRMGA